MVRAVLDRASEEELQSDFDGSGYGADPLMPEERQLVAHARGLKNMPESVRLECPEWAYAGLKRAFPETFESEMQAMQCEAPLDLRVNTLKATREDVLKHLRGDGLEVVPTPYSPWGLRVQGRPPFSMHPLYQHGHMEVQDEGSQLLSLLCDVKPGEWVVDFCAGAGGKTMALAAMMQNKGRIWACDVEERRLDNARKRFRRSGIHCVETICLTDERDDWVRKHSEKADCVLIDAPCSGVGTWRRNPFARWQNLGPQLETLVPLQASILESASRLVKPGGRLVYATCSMLPEENIDQVHRFLAAHPDFKWMPLSSTAVPVPFKGEALQLTPHQHQTDGFFAACMARD